MTSRRMHPLMHGWRVDRRTRWGGDRPQNGQQFRLGLYGGLVSLRAAPPQHPAGLVVCRRHPHTERGDWPQNSQQFRLGLYGELVSLRAAPPQHPAGLTACHWHRHVERGDWPQNSHQFRLGLYGGLVSLRAAPPKHPAELHVSFNGAVMWTIPRFPITRPSQPYQRVTQR